MNNLTIDDINEGLMNNLKDELNTQGVSYHEKDGNIWFTIGGKTYKAYIRFEEYLSLK